MRKSCVLIASLTLLAACAEPPKVNKPRSQMTQRERDSTIGASRLPGSGVVRKGMNMADAQAKRAAALDSLTGSN